MNSYKLEQLASLRKGKCQYPPSDLTICIELEHIEKETGRIIRHSQATEKSSVKNAFKSGDVLFGKLRPYLRKFALADFDGICSSDIWAMNPNTKIITKEYLFYLIQSEKFMRVACKTTGTKMPRSDWKLLQNLTFQIPDIRTQHSLVKILRTWDTAIEKTESLIAAKQKRFKWLLYNSLISSAQSEQWQSTQLYKIANIKRGWRKMSLEDACKVITSPVDKKTIEKELPVKLCNYTDVYYNNTINSKISFMAATAKPQEIEKFSLVKGDVIITKDSETPDDIGVPAYVEETIDNLLCGYHLAILRPNKQTEGKYVCYVLICPRVKYDFYRFANGITRFGLTAESFKKIKIPIPSLLEQKSIANTLNTAQQEIKLLEQLAERYRTQKRGLMQKLLAGKWRVKDAA